MFDGEYVRQQCAGGGGGSYAYRGSQRTIRGADGQYGPVHVDGGWVVQCGGDLEGEWGFRGFGDYGNDLDGGAVYYTGECPCLERGDGERGEYGFSDGARVACGNDFESAAGTDDLDRD